MTQSPFVLIKRKLIYKNVESSVNTDVSITGNVGHAQIQWLITQTELDNPKYDNRLLLVVLDSLLDQRLHSRDFISESDLRIDELDHPHILIGERMYTIIAINNLDFEDKITIVSEALPVTLDHVQLDLQIG